jgi:transcriptional regulator with XRE-family HTH domain
LVYGNWEFGENGALLNPLDGPIRMRTLPIDTPLSHVLRQLRAARAMPQKVLSERSRCSTGYLSRMENGLCAPTDPDLLKRIAVALSLSEREQSELIEAARESKLIVHLPPNVGWKAYSRIHKLIRHLPIIDEAAWLTIETAISDIHEEERSATSMT